MTSADGASGRRIWLCADDYGIAPGVNAAIRDLAARGRLNAASVMTVAPSFTREETAALAALNVERPRVAIGLHVTLTAPYRPLSSGFRPLHGGAFPTMPALLRAALLGRLDAGALKRELAAQLAAFTAAFGRAPDFVDGHQHVHLFPRVRDAVLAAAREFAPSAWVRQCGQVGGSARLRDPKGLLIDYLSRSMRRRAEAQGVATNPAFAGTYTYRPNVDFARLFPRFLAGLPEGSVVMCHPGFVDPQLRSLDPLTDLREREHAYFASDTFTQDLAQARVRLAEVARR